MSGTEYKKILQRQNTRSLLQQYIREQFLAFDLDSNHLIYSKDGISYLDFYNSGEIDSKLANLDASHLTTGTIDPARIPVLPSQLQIVSTGDLTALTAPQQAQIGQGSIVTTIDGFRWVYSGSGAKTLATSYTQLADITPEWATISNKPTSLAGYSILASDTLFDGKYLGIGANAVSATKLQTARTIAGVSFNGTANISIPYANLSSIPSTFTPSAHTHAIADTTGLQAALDAKLSIASASSTYQPLGAYLTLSSVLAGYVVGANSAIAATDSVLGAFQKLQGQINNKQASGSYSLTTHNHDAAYLGISANAVSSTKLATARTIAGVSFDGTAAIAIPYANLTGLPTLGTLAAKSTVTWTSDLTGVPAPIASLGLPSQNGNIKIGNNLYNSSTWYGIEFSDPKARQFLINDTTGTQRSGVYSATEGWIWSFAANGALDFGTVPWSKLTSIPSTFTPSAHTHTIADSTGLQAALDAKLSIATASATYQVLGAYITLSSPLAGYVVGANTALAATDSILGAFQKLQGQINNKQASGSYSLTTHNHNTAYLGISANAVSATKLATARTINGISFDGTANISIPYANLTSIPSTFTPSAHSHIIGDVTGLQAALDGKSLSSHTHTFASLTSKPTTLSGYGITDAATSAHNHDSTYLKLSGGTVTGQIQSANVMHYFAKDVQINSGANTNYSNAPIQIARAANTGTTYQAGLGFHNPGVNASFLYYSSIDGDFWHNDHTGGIYKLWTSKQFSSTDITNWQNGLGRISSLETRMNGVDNTWSNYANVSHSHDFSAVTGRTKSNNPSARIDSGWYEYQPTTKANGWPEDSSWWHLMSSTHSNGSNYFALQIASNFYDQDFRIRSTNGNGLTAWSKIWTSTNFAQSDITNWQNGLGRISSLETRMNGVDNTWSNYLPLAGGTISGSIKGTSRSGDGGAYLFAPGTGTSSGISNGTNSPVISRYVYSGFTGFVAHNEEFYGMCNDHCSFGGGAELSIVAGTESGHISFFAGKPVLNGNGSYEAPRVGNWTNAGLSITGTLSVSGAITGSNLNVSNWNTAYEWGNHASAGYVTLSDSQTITGIKTFNADVNISTNRGLYIQGNSVAHFGGATWVDTIYSIRNNGKTLLSNDVSIISGTSGWGEGLRIVGGLANWSGIRFTTVNDSTARNGNWAVGYCADSSGNLVFSGYDGTAQKNVFRFYQSGGASLDGDFNATGAITGSNLNISNWNTAYTNSHTHSNKANLDTINQNLGTTSTALFAALNVNGKIIASEVSADINWTNIIYTPTTIAGYGITDAVNSSDSRLHSHSNIGTLNGIDQGLSTTDTVRFHVLYTTQGILAGSTIAAWRDETNYVAVGTGNITATGTVYAAELNTPWNINTNYNFYGKKAYNTSSWGSTGGLATNGIDTWLGATNSVNVFVGGVTNVLTANSGQITLGVKTYCNQFCSNTSFAGTGLFAGTGDGASLTTYNHKLTSWYGTGIYDACNGVNRGYIDHRTGSMYLNGSISAGNFTSPMYTTAGNLTLVDGSPQFINGSGRTITCNGAAGYVSGWVKYISGGNSVTIVPNGTNVIYNGVSRSAAFTGTSGRAMCVVCLAPVLFINDI